MPIIEQTPICDTYIAKSCPNTNFRTRTSLFIGRFTNTKNIYRSLLVFNTPKIPDGDILITAYLRLYVYKKYVSGVQKVNVYRITDSFNPNKVTYNTQPKISQTTISYYVSNDALNNYIDIDVRELVIGWINRDFKNYGLELMNEENSNALIGFPSTNFPINDLKPTLIVNYATGNTGQSPEITIIPLVNRYYYIAESDLSSPDLINLPANLFKNDSNDFTKLFLGLGPNSYNNLFINGILQMGRIYSVGSNTLTLSTEGATIYKGTPIILEIIQFSASGSKHSCSEN